jgi:polyhydroxybutyrate depolymerase
MPNSSKVPRPRAHEGFKIRSARAPGAFGIGGAIVVAIMLLVCWLRAAETPSITSGDHDETLQFGGITRTFIVHVPGAFDPHRKTALVIMLHGRGGSGARVERNTGWDRMADRENFLAVFPDATLESPGEPGDFMRNPRRWIYASDAGAHQTDVIGFIAALIDYMERSYGADPRRVYVTGFSNGGSMTWQIGAKLTSRIAAIAPVSGTLQVKDAKLTSAMPTMFIIGTADPLNPLSGGSVKPPWDSAGERSSAGRGDARGVAGGARMRRRSAHAA